MRQGKGLFRRRARDQTAGSAWPFPMGMTASGKRVSERTAMQTSAVYACVRVLSEAVAGLPLHFYRQTDGGKEKAVDHPLYFLLHDEPNPEMTSFSFREALMTHLLLWGNAYAQVIRNGKDEVVALYPLMPDRMAVSRDDRGFIYYEYRTSPDDPDTGKKGDTVVLKPHEVLHVVGLGFDGLVGYSPIAMAKNAIGLGMAAEEYGSKFYSNGATPGGVLQHPSVLKDPAKLRESWEAAFGGTGNSHKIAVLEEGMTYNKISISPNEAQFLETRKFQTEEIARIFRVPLHMIGDLEHATFSNVEELSLDFVKFSLEPWLVRWEQSLSRCLLTEDEKRSGLYFHFNADGLMRGDYESRMRGYATARQNGWMSCNDIRSLENLDLVPSEQGGDLYLVNGNMLPLVQAGLMQQQKKEADSNAKQKQ